MSSTFPTQSVQALLDEAKWIRTLARRLARDEAEADDLVQETLVSALEHPPQREEGRRAWLATVAANAARALRRSSSRREARERCVARAESLASTAELVERAAVQRELVEAVLGLDEPYRAAVLLRFYEGLPPRAIARRLGVPVATVRTRTSRALARLRARLDRDHGGDRTAWLALVLPPPGAGSLSIPLTGGLLLNAKAAALSAAVLLTVAAFVWLRPPTESADPGSVAQAAEIAALSGNSPDPLSDSEARAGKEARAPVEPEPAVRADPAPGVVEPAVVTATPRLRGIVLDGEGVRIAGVPVGLQRTGASPVPLGRSGADGRFDLPYPSEPGRLVGDSDAWCTVLSALPSAEPESSEAVLVLAPRLHLAGLVVDASGAIVSNARLELEMPTDLRARFTLDLDRSARVEAETRSDGDGRFEFAGLPRLRGAHVVVSANGFDTLRVEISEIVDPFTFVLTRPGEHAEVLQGFVIDAQGSVVEDALVAFGLETVRTDADGRFVFRLDDPRGWNASLGVAPTLLRALKRGFLPASREVAITDGRPQWPASVTLRLGLETLSIGGRVRGTDGAPRAGLNVWVADSEVFGAGSRGPVILENLLAGDEERLWSSVETDADGRFEIHGLLPRAYVLRAQDPETLLMVEEEGVDAGRQDVNLLLPADGLYLRVAGVVRGADGAPVAGVRVHPMCDAYRARYEGQVVSTSHNAIEGVVTDAEGRFELKSVPRSLVYLRLDGAGILPLEYGRYAKDDPRLVHARVQELPRDRIESLDIRVDRRAHVQIQLADPMHGDAFQLLDEDGRPIELSVFEGNSRHEGEKAEILEGRSPVVGGSDRGRTLVLLKQGAEVARRPVVLVPGETTLVAW